MAMKYLQRSGKTNRWVAFADGDNIGALLRGNDVIVARRQVVIEEGDHVVIYLSDKKNVPEIEKLFQPSASSFNDLFTF